MAQLQTIIHQIEQGIGLRVFKWVLLVMALLVFLLGYNLRGFKNMANPEAMDAAQLGRNLAEGKGYKTLFVRPFSVYLLQQDYAIKHGPAPVGDLTDRGQIRVMHPDISNPPVYPLALACLMKLSPGLRQQAAGTATLNIGKKRFNPWNFAGGFWIYPPDFWIGLFNEFIFMTIAVLLFALARWLFDMRVAWTSAGIFVGTDIFWRFSMSGLSTMLLTLIFVGLTWCLALLERASRENSLPQGKQFLLAAAIGMAVGLGCLTRYSFGWLIIPVLVFLVLFLRERQLIVCMIALAVFTAIVSPWVIRNYSASHTFFGTAGYVTYEHTAYFPENRLERSLNPDLTRVSYSQIWKKMTANIRVILQDDLPKLGGSWLSAFFLVGLLITYNNAGRSRLRYFVLFCLPVLVITQALGKTQLSDDSPIINSENLLVLLSPLIILFGVSLFLILLDQLHLPFSQLRYALIGVFCFFICLPALFSLISSRVSAVAYPPYYPPIIQKTSAWMKPDEMIMTDIPWAVAWYGERQSMWLTLNAQSDFFSVYDYQKPVKAVYLTQITMDGHFLTDMIHSGEHSWGSFALESMLKKELPPYFPLKHAPEPFLPGQFFLTDSDRWGTMAAP